MTWEELVEKAKEMGYDYWRGTQYVSDGDYEFYKDGTIKAFACVDDSYYSDFYEIAWNRTYEQMLAIMEALR